MNKKIDKTYNSFEICPLCNKSIERLSTHLKSAHTPEELEKAILNDKNKGMPDIEIGRKYGITYRQLEMISSKRTISAINNKVPTFTYEFKYSLISKNLELLTNFRTNMFVVWM